MIDGEDLEEPPPPRAPRSPAPQPPAPDVYESPWVWAVVLGALGTAVSLLWGWSVFLVIAIVVAIITIHELGHYLTARWTGMKVTEFFLGFGPKLWSFQRGETEYGLKLIPAGAYVRIIGMNNLEEVDPADEPRTYRQQSFPKRLLVVLAGPGTHFIQAAIIIFVLLTVAGVPGGSVSEAPSAWVVSAVTDGSAAAEAGLQPGDRVLTFDGHDVSTFDDLTSLIRSTDVGDRVPVVLQRDGQRVETVAEIGPRPRDVEGGLPGTPFFGIGPTAAPDETVGALPALLQAPRETADVTWQAVTALGHFFSPRGLGDYADSVSDGGGQGSQPATSNDPGGDGGNGNDGRLVSIVGAIRIGAALAEEGWPALLMFVLSINIFVGLINLIPLLPFDGGHAAVAVYERLRSRRGHAYHADVAKLMPIVYAVFMGLVLLGITAVYLDLVNPVEL